VPDLLRVTLRARGCDAPVADSGRSGTGVALVKQITASYPEVRACPFFGEALPEQSRHPEAPPLARLTIAMRLVVGSAQATSVFDLLGRKENDLTFAIGWCLAESTAFLRHFVMLAGGVELDDFVEVELRLQSYDRDDVRIGITDIEVRSPKVHLIVEAKRGWGLPSRQQLARYAPILRRSRADPDKKRFVVLTRWGSESAAIIEQQIGRDVARFPISTIGVADVMRAGRLALAQERSQRPRLFLRDLLAYLEGGGYVANHRDSRVMVVALGKSMSEIGIHHHEIPYKRGVYWYGLKSGLPPNYVAFRFDGRLQSIHHVERSQVFTRISDVFPEAKTDWGSGVLLHLGPAIHPPNTVRSGKLRDRRVSADIDLLLTSATVEEAERLTRERDLRAAG
jgi:hypothetical protein